MRNTVHLAGSAAGLFRDQRAGRQVPAEGAGVCLQERRARVAEAMEEVRFPAGRVVFREGEAGDCFYLVRSGVAVVSRGQGPDRQVLARLREGAFFGERALLRAETRCLLGAASLGGQARILHPLTGASLGLHVKAQTLLQSWQQQQ